MSYLTRYHAQFCYKFIAPNPISKDFFDELTLSWLNIHCTCSSALAPDFSPPTVKSSVVSLILCSLLFPPYVQRSLPPDVQDCPVSFICMIALFILFFHHTQSSLVAELCSRYLIFLLYLALPPRSLANVATPDRRERLIIVAHE